jgi:Superfamily I DNA and RNA helicases and helicase subunits
VIKDMKANGALGVPDPIRDALTLKKLRVEGEAIDRLDKLLSCFKGWEGHTTSPDTPLALQMLGQRARLAIGGMADDAPTLVSVRGRVRTLMQDANDLLAPEAAVGRAAQAFVTANKALKDACEAFEAIAGRSVREHFAETGKALDAIRETADTIAARHAELREWCGWRRRRTEALDLELRPLVDAIEKGRIPIEEIEATFEAAYCTWWSGAVIGEDEVLRTFSTPEHVATIEKFREIDSQFQKLTAAYISAKLTGNIPDTDDVKRSSSWGVLGHEIQKKRKHKPVRQLIQEIPDVLTKLAPCLMMSPLSVAQYLPADQALFDVVIFDEASQITVWDAVGSLARGRQVIVAGDPKQMPPTNFFARADDDPDGEVDAEDDLESILDEMLGASIPQSTLNLHYRSRRESLIAFSNSRYYGNQLITFPAPYILIMVFA